MSNYTEPCTSQLTTLATEIWDNEFGDEKSEIDREIEIEGIQAWLESNIGQLNLLINTDYYIETKTVKASPDADCTYITEGTCCDVNKALCPEERTILTLLYLKAWYKKQARNILRGMGVSTYTKDTETNSSSGGGTTTQTPFGNLSDDWTMIKEGDTTITRSRSTSSSSGPSSFSSVSNESSKIFEQLSQDIELKLLDFVSRYNLHKAQAQQVEFN